MKQLPNIITILRILLVIPIMILLARQHYALVLWLFVVAALSDALDGYLARRYHWQSWLGSVLDPLADKVMLVGSYLVLAWSGWLPWWLVIMVIGRDVVILLGAGMYRWRCGSLHIAPTAISKANTLLQMLLGILVIVFAAGLLVPVVLLQALILVVALTTLWSGLGYVLEWSARARVCRQRT
ncbi:MAG: CDP-alcohol phosphatidyltransferase family protein [Chromatiales bacterium]|nr:CDP-alcohol phosphatidyltransferase family protein [Gammaproteobacteria bacterium]MBW6477587.1 CDP-alcohol phosphatidyltransferase family protein [Chromatiales bacterium]